MTYTPPQSSGGQALAPSTHTGYFWPACFGRIASSVSSCSHPSPKSYSFNSLVVCLRVGAERLALSLACEAVMPARSSGMSGDRLPVQSKAVDGRWRADPRP